MGDGRGWDAERQNAKAERHKPNAGMHMYNIIPIGRCRDSAQARTCPGAVGAISPRRLKKRSALPNTSWPCYSFVVSCHKLFAGVMWPVTGLLQACHRPASLDLACEMSSEPREAGPLAMTGTATTAPHRPAPHPRPAPPPCTPAPHPRHAPPPRTFAPPMAELRRARRWRRRLLRVAGWPSAAYRGGWRDARSHRCRKCRCSKSVSALPTADTVATLAPRSRSSVTRR